LSRENITCNTTNDTPKNASQLAQIIRDQPLADKFLQSLDSPSAVTVTGYSHDLRKFGEFIAPTAFGDVTREHVRAYRDHMVTKGLSRNTQKRYLATISSFYHFLADEGILQSPPIPRKLVVSKSRDRQAGSRTSLSKEQIEALLRNLDNQLKDARISCRTKWEWKLEKALRDRAFIHFLYKTGARNSEMRALEKTDLDMIAREARITGKGEKIRFVVFDSDTREIIEEYLNYRRDSESILFRSRKGGQMAISTIIRCFRDYCNQVALPKWVTPHALRHTLATRMMELGLNVKFISEFLGHSSIKITLDIYSHLSRGTKKDIYDSISL
jgi:site-specific recombinase XerD